MASSTARSGMALKSLLVATAAVLLVAPFGAAQPSSSSPAPSSSGSCMTEMVSLASCLGYMSGNATKPSASCCSSLSSVVTSNPRCLCVVLGGGAASLGVTINSTRALELPGACNVKTPPASQCKSVGVPVPSPPATPSTPSTTTPASPESPSVPSATPSGSGTKATQTAQSSGGQSIGKAASTLPVAAAVLSAAFALLRA